MAVNLLFMPSGISQHFLNDYQVLDPQIWYTMTWHYTHSRDLIYSKGTYSTCEYKTPQPTDSIDMIAL